MLDVGAGTGFLSLAAARLGHRVTALDLSGGMLERACGPPPTARGWRSRRSRAGPRSRRRARSTPWSSGTCCGRCPTRAALAAWRAVALEGRLVLFEGLWGGADYRGPAWAGQEGLRKLRGEPDHHHDHYDPSMLEELPLAAGTPPDQLVELVEEAGWGRSG